MAQDRQSGLDGYSNPLLEKRPHRGIERSSRSVVGSWSKMELPRLAYTKEEAARILGVGVSTIDWLLRKNALPRRKIGRRILFTLGDLQALVDASKVEE